MYHIHTKQIAKLFCTVYLHAEREREGQISLQSSSQLFNFHNAADTGG
jgi:hypothetical protein